MFKLESYLTPLLLGYVDKYVKNLKSDDFQLSLWGGDALFTNLDLRLDVLEEEFHLPFTFTNGHIHELRLHVPWTKLGSEPIVITIETIECVLTLKQSTGSDGSSSELSKPKSESLRKKQRKAELLQEAPPGYVKGFISRIVNNISVVCNNLILKYVEDDIVLSLNIKSAEMYNVDEGWDRAFTDLSAQNPVLRRVINMHDLTMCLDKRNASGIIEVYQDPLLFRCSAWCRMYKSYDNPHSKLASMTHISIYCDQLDFSITDQQLPMFVHLMELCLALYNGDIMPDVKPTDTTIDIEEESEDQEGQEPDPELGWGSWAWSYVPQIIPTWDEDREQDITSGMATHPPSHTFRFRLLIERMSVVFKTTQRLRSSKFNFRNEAVIRLYGTSVGVIQHAGRFVNCQMGVTAAEVIHLDNCLCGGANASERVFLQSGIMPGEGHTYSFLTSSLFDPLSPENGSNEVPLLILDWEQHLDCLTENVMLDRFPAFAMDFLYELDVPQEWSDKMSELTATFLESNNWHERSLCRFVVGRTCLNVTSSLVHLLTSLFDCAKKHEYTPYSSQITDLEPVDLEPVGSVSSMPPPSEDDVRAMEAFVPTRSYHIIWHQPIIKIHLPDHSRGLGSKDRPKRKETPKIQDSKVNVNGVPILLRASTIDFHLSMAFYPKKVAHFVTTMQETSDILMHYCFKHMHFKAFQLELTLLTHPREHLLVPPFSLACLRKVLQLPLQWEVLREQGRGPPARSEFILELAQWQAQMSKSHLHYLICLILAWVWDTPLPLKLTEALLQISQVKDEATLVLEVKNLTSHSVETWHSFAHQMSLASFTVQLQSQNSRVILVQAPEKTNSFHNASFFRELPPNESVCDEPLVTCVIQIPKTSHKIVEQAVVSLHINGFALNMDPVFFSWLEFVLDESILIQQPVEIIQQSVNSNASSPSNERSSTYSMSRTTSAATLEQKLQVPTSGWQSCIPDWYQRLFKHAIILVEVRAVCVLCPMASWPSWYAEGEKAGLVAHLRDVARVGQEVPLSILALPHIKISNQAANNFWHACQLSVPVLQPPVGGVMFPWTITFSVGSLYTLETLSQSDCGYVVKPVGASITLAVSEPLAQLAFCVHVDMEPLYLSVSKSQVFILSQVIDQFLIGAHQLLKAYYFYSQLTSVQASASTTNSLEQPPMPVQHAQAMWSGSLASPRGSEGFFREPSSPIERIVLSPEIKLTLWMQWTLPKVGISFLTSDASSEQVWLQLEAEEVTASLDIQPVFLKGKAKLTSLNISSFQRNTSSTEWQPGSYDGIILCGLDKISRNLVPSTTRSEYKAKSPSNKSLPSFLSFTFTRVLCSSVEQYWAKKLKDLQLESGLGGSTGTKEPLKYISEFDMKLDRFDVVLWMPLFSSIVDIVSPIKVLMQNPLCLELTTMKDMSGNSFKQPIGWGLNVSNLPLLYLHIGTVRLFLPSNFEDGKSETPFDVALVQVNSLTLLPQAENLLSRIVINEQVYMAAEKAGSLYVPGAPVEDRQYQLDMRGLTLTTVLWQDIREGSNISCSLPPSIPTLGQNPAVEWNNCTVPLGEEDDTIVMHPIIVPFDLKVVAAPAVVCNSGKANSNQPTKEMLICGHSLELNAVTDVDIYLSFQSLSLLQEVLKNNLLNGTSQLAQNIQGLSSFEGSTKLSLIKDSGIDSEVASGQQLDMTLLSLLTNPLLASSTDVGPCLPFVPSELLLTANKVFLTLFLNETDFKEKLYPTCGQKRKTLRRSKQKAVPIVTDTCGVKNKKGSKHQKKKEPVSLESSPERVFPIPPRKPKISLTVESSEDGYDGSNDSSSSSSILPPSSQAPAPPTLSAEGKEIKSYPRIHPFMHIVLSQPHTFVLCRAETQKIQVSCFDLSIKCGRHNLFIDALGPAYCPLPTHFSVPWLETIPGDTDSKTGIPPPWLNFTISDFLSRPRQVSVCWERPTLIHLSVNRLHQARSVFLSKWPHLMQTGTSDEASLTPIPFINRLKAALHQVPIIKVSVVHLAANIESYPSTNSEQTLGVSISGLSSKVQLKTGKTDEKVLTELSVQDFLVNVNCGKVCRHVLGPFSPSGTLEVWWPTWLRTTSSTDPHLATLKVSCGPLFLTLAPKQLQIIKSTLEIWGTLTKNSAPDSSNDSAPEKNKTYSPCPHKKEPAEIHTCDDIRNGSFEFLHDWDGQGISASPGEVVFCKEPAEKQGTMTWCYHEPRILTRVEIYPVPLQSSSQANKSTSKEHHTSYQILCSLQYWESFRGEFVDWQTFELQESSSSILDLPPASPETLHTLSCTHKWRVLLKCSDPEGDYLPVLPNVLAACMRVDSSFHPSYVPSLQVSLHIDFIQVTFCNFFRNLVIPDVLYPFQSDGQFIQEQEFLTVSIDNTSLSCKHWNNKTFKLNTNSTISCEILEYRNLTLQMLMEPVDLHLSMLISNTVDKKIVIESEANVEPCYFRLGQAALYTLKIALQSWNQFRNHKDHGEQIIPNYYVICNNTQENIRFGQVNTDESVLLASQKFHAYSWRSHKSQQLMRLCLESMYWKWCDPFCLDSVGTKVRVMDSKGYSVTLIIHIRKISNIQKQVIITGQVSVSSRISQTLEVRLLNQPSPPYWMECRLPQSPCQLPPFSTLAAQLLTSAQPMAIQLRVQQVDAGWSSTILITGKETLSLQLIKIPGHQPFDVWCKIVSQEIMPHVNVQLVVLCPVFILRNHLPVTIIAHLQTGNPSTSTCLEVAGEGQDTQLLTNTKLTATSSALEVLSENCDEQQPLEALEIKDPPSESKEEEDSQLIFQLASNMQPSSPAVHLPPVLLPSSTEVSADKVNEGLTDLADVSLEDLCYNWLPVESFCWPYLDKLQESKLNELTKRNSLLQYETSTFSKVSEIPDTQLNVCMYQPWPGFPTYLVDIKPWALFVNESGCDLYFQGGSDWQQWHLHKGTAFSPPPFKSTFIIAVEQDGNFYSSMQIKFSGIEDETSDSGPLKLEPGIPISLTIHMVVADLQKVFRLSVSLHMKDNMYVVVFRPLVNLLNFTPVSLQISGSLGTPSNQISKKSTSYLVNPVPEGQSQSFPILLWDLPDPSLLTTGATPYMLRFYPIRSDSVNLPVAHDWCPAVPLITDLDSSRHTVSTTSRNHPEGFVITCHKQKGIQFVSVYVDYHPLLCIHNRTEFPLLCGEAVDNSAKPAAINTSDQLLCIPSGSTSFYTFPSINKVFPNSISPLPALWLAKDCSATETSENNVPATFQHEMWSQPIDITSEVDHFVHIPDASDVRVHKEWAGHTMHTFLESVNRVEVSAKEIRSRIANKTHLVDIKAKEVVRTCSKLTVIEDVPLKKKEDPILYLSVFITHICGILCDDVTDPFVSEEVLRLSLDDALIVVRPYLHMKERMIKLTKQEVTVCIGNLQMDNQLSRPNDIFDFKVLAIPQNKPVTRLSTKEYSTLGHLAKHSEKAVLTANIILDLLSQDNRFIVQKISVKMEPLSLYLEDAFYHHLIDLKSTFLNSNLVLCRSLLHPEPLVPKDVLVASKGLASPLPIVQLEVLPISVLVSLRASLKLYLAVDHSPLSFQVFQQQYLYTSSYGLGQLLTVHFVTGALLRAGWVVGSLDLLGNPTGLARALGTGFSDLVLMPYRGLFQGPWAFITGVSHGTASLLKQISSGAVISVTNLAASISRNMDRLSLDAEHCQRLEEMRHSPPEGLASGLKQGLTGFGISLLGAIAGIVDHPIQAMVSPTSKDPLTPPAPKKGLLRTASGIMGGASRGLVGMVVKPIGGAAELISQAGTGLLQGVGWRSHPQARYVGCRINCSDRQSSQLKFAWKMVQGLIQGSGGRSNGQVLMCLEASHTSQPGHHVSDILFLSPHILTIVSKEEDRQQQIFGLTEIDCCGCPDNPSILYVTIKPKTPGVPIEVDRETTKRVAEYVHQVSSEFGHLMSSQNFAENSPNVSWRDAYQFYVFPKHRNFFVALFNIEQRKLMGKRFPL